MAVSTLQLLLLIAVTQAAVPLTDSMLTTDLLRPSCVCGPSHLHISHQEVLLNRLADTHNAERHPQRSE